MTHTDSTSSTLSQLPPVAPQVTAAAVADLTPRLRKKLDATVESLAALPITVSDDGIHLECGAEAMVTLAVGPSGVITDADQARCTCLLAPRCLHRAAVLTGCPVADPAAVPDAASERESAGAAEEAATAADQVAAGGAAGKGRRRAGASAEGRGSGPDSGDGGRTRRGTAPTKAQRAAASALWQAAGAVLAAGVPGAGAVPQAELLRAAHGARLAGLPRAESAALRVVRSLRAARGRHNSHRLADLVEVLQDLLLTTGRLAAGDPDPALIGVLRRSYKPGGSLRVYGVCREPVISATGYAGVVTHLLSEDGHWFSLADVKPGGPERARDSATGLMEIGPIAVNLGQLARGGLRISGATISPDGRLGAGRGVRVNVESGLAWSAEPLASLFARPLAEVVSAQLAANDGEVPEDSSRTGAPLIGCDLVVIGAAGDHVLARELSPGPFDAESARSAVLDGPLIRLVPANSHSALSHVPNLRRLASWPGLRIRVVGQLDPGRAATLRPLAVGPVPGAGPTLQLPENWHGRMDLGYDELQGAHLPPRDQKLMMTRITEPGPDPLLDSPLWRVRRLVELAVAGGRRAVGETVRTADSGLGGPLRRAGFHGAAELAAALGAESDRQERDTFGRLVDPDPDRYAWAWVASATHLAATERELVRASWNDSPISSPGDR
ncbi:hypothetical protein ACWDV4_09100 [Micromonospora sp. NPDC003197]